MGIVKTGCHPDWIHLDQVPASISHGLANSTSAGAACGLSWPHTTGDKNLTAAGCFSGPGHVVDGCFQWGHVTTSSADFATCAQGVIGDEKPPSIICTLEVFDRYGNSAGRARNLGTAAYMTAALLLVASFQAAL